MAPKEINNDDEQICRKISVAKILCYVMDGRAWTVAEGKHQTLAPRNGVSKWRRGVRGPKRPRRKNKADGDEDLP